MSIDAANDNTELVIADAGRTSALILVDADAGEEQQRRLERMAAEDLSHYMELMTGAKPGIVSDPEAIEKALATNGPIFVVGELAMEIRPALRARLKATVRPTKVFDSDAIILERDGNKIFIAGSNDRCHYYAAVTLLNQWGCRWYMPTPFGEAVPNHPKLTLGTLDIAYAPPLEVRNYWNSWNSSTEGAEMFKLRNFMNDDRIKTGHILGKYVKEIIPEGGTHFNVPITDPRTAEKVADQINDRYAAGETISLGMEDGTYKSAYDGDAEVSAGIQDKYFQAPSMTDAFIVLYNNVAEILEKRHPASGAVLGFLAYVNTTMPPQREISAASSLFAEVAPIDIDPNHSMDDFRSPPRQEFKEMIYRWGEVMNGRVNIYDYDQGALVWRDIPNPSHHVFRKDVKHYRDAGTMGVSTESRGAFATVFTNLFFRGQLMWNPDVDVDNLFDAFYPSFYGIAAAPMQRYWEAIFDAWENTIVTEHEYYIIPAIYTPELVEELGVFIREAVASVKPLHDKDSAELTRNERLVLERIDFTEKSFRLIDLYTRMVRAAATDSDYTQATVLGREMLKTRLELAAMNPTFTTRVLGTPAVESAEPDDASSAALLPGEVQQYVGLEKMTDGTTGTLIKSLPLEWAFRRDPNDTGLARGWAGIDADLSFWEKNKERFSNADKRKDYPTTEWEVIRTDLYVQAQGILHPDWQSFTGFLWYKTEVNIDEADALGNIHIHFPGLFSEAWLYVNGYLVAHRPQNHMWWKNDYRFEWDVDLSGEVKAGENTITLRVHNSHHNGGMFRRPFLYRPN